MLPQEAGWTYVQARAAAMSGQHARSAELLASLAQSNPANQSLARKALAQAVDAGNMALAVDLARRLPPSQLSIDGRLLLITDALNRGRFDQAVALVSAGGDEGNLAFLDPLIRAWSASESRDLRGALAALDSIPNTSLANAFRDENRAWILLKFGRTPEALPFARRAVASAGPRETRLRLAFADSFLKRRDRAAAIAMVEGIGSDGALAADAIRRGRESGVGSDSPASAFGEVLLGLASDLSRVSNRGLPTGMVQVARFAAPTNSGAAVLLGLMLEAEDRHADALSVLGTVPAGDPLSTQALDARSRILGELDRQEEALALARAAVAQPGASYPAWSRLGEVLRTMGRHPEAADAYARAIDFARQHGQSADIWPLHLLRATSLEAADRWPEARQALQAGLAIAPDQPLLLNFLGYAKLERGEDLDTAEAMIRKAVALAPDNASITDSLGWALYKRGKLQDAIDTLQRAAARDPGQAEIHEHLGDALYASGRRYEARFAWNAALVTAEDDIATRVRAKLVSGLTPATAAP